ncbi:hypothetical protein QFC24_001877 [Naganishia onofrii]|uniref:Uncharacterized protein n=1 Tax=Naganishia onofrii TaxID=1851511 RepID=A0ACC2XTQ2_9TREE|nr:hypothetical protein QFC24_001877 [Naganishia onofrii]
MAKQQGGADIDQFLGKSKGSSGDNVLSSDLNNDSYGSSGSGNNQYSEQNQDRGASDQDDAASSNELRGQRGDAGVMGDKSKADTRERDNDYSGYSGEDCKFTLTSRLALLAMWLIRPRPLAFSHCIRGLGS